MTTPLENSKDAKECQLESFRRLFRYFQKIDQMIYDPTERNDICRYLKELIKVDRVSLFLLNVSEDHFELFADSEVGDQCYRGGILKMEDNVVDDLSVLRPIKSTDYEISVETEGKTYDLTGTHLFVLPIMNRTELKACFVIEHHAPFEIVDDNQNELITVYLSYISSFVKLFLSNRTLEKKSLDLELLHEIGHFISNIDNENLLLENIMDLIETKMLVDRCSLMTIGSKGKTLKIIKAFGMPGVDIKNIRIAIGEGIAGSVAASATPLFIKNLATESDFGSNADQKYFRTNSLVSVPLIAQGKVIGVININNRKDHQPFSREDMRLLSKIGVEIAIILQRSLMANQLKKKEELDNDINRFMV